MNFWKKKFPHYLQSDSKDCGPTCLRIICKYYDKNISLKELKELSETNRSGSSLMGLSDASERIGFRSLGIQTSLNKLVNNPLLPCIIYWNKNHFIVLFKITRRKGKYIFHVSDPAIGILTFSEEEFIKSWIGENANKNTEEGIALLLEPTHEFYKNDFNQDEKKISLSFLSKHLLTYKSLIIQLSIGLLTGSLLSLILPFLTQSIVDIGIHNQNIDFIYIIVLAQIMLFIGRMCIEIIRNWILLHLSTRINISIISGFFIKLMKLPISFFDAKMTGDIMQRINDHSRIEQFLTNSSLNTIFSLINLIIYSAIIFLYDYRLFLFYFLGASLYIAWISFFLKKRRELDYKKFSQISEEQSKVIEIINGMQEIKMHNAEKQKRWNWEFLQIKIFKIKIKALNLEQWQYMGGSFINHLKDITISFLSAKLVLNGNLTLGMMLSVQYIVGQLNSPLVQLIDFIRQYQDAIIGLERLEEIHNKTEEEDIEKQYIAEIPKKDIVFNNVYYRYKGSDKFIFEDLSLRIPFKKTTAIVGSSGSGKSTLLKLLMKFYEPNQGKIKIGNIDLKNISPTFWRKHCGVVMQDGYIFNDTITENIIIGDELVDKQRLKKAVEIANIKDFIEDLPLSYNTKIGNEGLGISGGQKQRIFIARAVYKSPSYIFFDEATSALDSNNEKIIMKNLRFFLQDKTAIIIAHRLSTVKYADKIIVLDNGIVVEEGNHTELIALKGTYYRLVKNQLDLG